jgi:hypothetical protein
MTEDEGLFHIRMKPKNSDDHFIATLPAAFSNEHTRIEAHLQGVRVTTPGQEPIYINAETRQISRNEEVVRSSMIIDPRFVDIGRANNENLMRAAGVIYGKDPRLKKV